jgi:hypothetical protein
MDVGSDDIQLSGDAGFYDGNTAAHNNILSSRAPGPLPQIETGNEQGSKGKSFYSLRNRTS